jgi:hypothetical protein
MYTATETHRNESFFRCPILSDSSKATLKMGWRRVHVEVQDTSIDGFTILVPATSAKRLKVGTPWVLEFDGSRIETHAQWFYHGHDGNTQIGLRRMRDLTPVERIGSWYTGLLPSRARSATNDSTVACAGFTILLFVLMAMPGLGDQLGTSSRIQSATKWIYHGLMGLW